MINKKEIRQRIRTKIPKWYNCYLHLISSFSVLFFSLSIAIYFLITEWSGYLNILTLIFFFIFSNLIEYTLHRWFMHRSILKFMYKRHAGIHHRLFTHDSMMIDKNIDLYYTIPSFDVTVYTILIGLVLYTLLGFYTNIGIAAAAATGTGIYIILQELLHLLFHLPDTNFLKKQFNKFQSFKNFEIHHINHHNTKLMRNFNFNIAFPIFDKLLKTQYKN